MRSRTFFRFLRTVSVVVLFFFVWTFGPIWQVVAYAATGQGTDARVQTTDSNRKTGANSIPADSNSAKFEKALDEMREKAGKAEEKAGRGEAATEEIGAIKAKKAEIESLDIELRKEFAATEKKLKDAKLPQEILNRHYKFVKHYDDNYNELKRNLDGHEKAHNAQDKVKEKEFLQKIKAHLEKTKPPKKAKHFNPDRLPTGTRNLKPVQISSWFNRAIDWLIPSAEAADLAPTSADLAETIETQQTQEIRDLAQKLGGTSVSLYEYVRNIYTYEPYAGSTKGAVQTLREKSGNEWDQTSLLIALYRASGIPCRYVVGTVEIPIDSTMSWLGVEDAKMAATLLSTLGRPTSLVISGGKITAIRTQQVWVRAFVPFLYSRGATSGSGDMWVDVDPSFKGQIVTKTLTVTGVPVFDQTSYLSTFRTESPFDFYRAQLQSFLDTNNPGYVPEALAWENEITPERFGVLIGQPPYIIKSVIGTYNEIPDAYRQKFTLSITDPASGDSLLYYSAPMPQIIGKRMTLSYIPATTADADVIANYGGLYSTPTYLTMLKPEIKIDGVSVAQGNTIGSGHEQKMEFIFDTTIDQGRVENIIVAGGYYAIGLGARSGDTRENILERTNQLATIAGKIDLNDPATLDQKLGEILYLSAVVYHQNLDAITKKIAALDRVVDVRDVSEMMYFLTLKVDSAFGMPTKITPAGITGDMDRNLHTVVPVNGDMNRIKPFMQLQGNVSSFLEHDVTEKIYRTQALSAVKGIQLAHDTGIPVHTINSQNISTELPMLQLSSELKADIANAVSAGQEVLVPERNLALGIWSGVGYIVQDQNNGKGAYLISGGYGGIVTVRNDVTQDLVNASMPELASQTNNATHRIQICYPGEDNYSGTSDDICYSTYVIGELEEDCPNDANCSKKYQIGNINFAQRLIKLDEHGDYAHLTKNITASNWQSQDGALYMRAGVSILSVIEILLTRFSCSKANTETSSGSGFRTYTRNLTLSGHSNTSHHLDGVAADIIIDTPLYPYIKNPPQCAVLNDAYRLWGGFSEVLSEGHGTAHIATPSNPNNDIAKYPADWSLDNCDYIYK